MCATLDLRISLSLVLAFLFPRAIRSFLCALVLKDKNTMPGRRSTYRRASGTPKTRRSSSHCPLRVLGSAVIYFQRQRTNTDHHGQWPTSSGPKPSGELRGEDNAKRLNGKQRRGEIRRLRENGKTREHRQERGRQSDGKVK